MDCMEFMKSVPDKHYDLAIIDPPYGIDKAKGLSQEYFDQLLRISKNQIVFGFDKINWPNLSKGRIKLDKGFPETMNFKRYEIAYCSLEEEEVTLPFTLADMRQEKMVHPSEKPIQLYKYLLNKYAKQGNKILDTFGGIGSIIIACYDMDFDLDWMEIHSDYYKIALKRFEDHKLKL